MRLGTKTAQAIDSVVHTALAGETKIIVPASDMHRARLMFNAISNRVEMLGGRADSRRLAWKFTNGSEIAFKV